MGAFPLRDMLKAGRKTTSISARKRDLVLKENTSLKGFVATLATGLSFGSGRNRSVGATVRRLLNLARHARVSRDFEALDTISDLVLESFNYSPFAEVARFHKARCLQARGDLPASRKLLNEVIERAGSKFRARGILALGASHHAAGEYLECSHLYIQAARAADETDPLSHVQSLRAVAIVRGIEGDHSGSLTALQALLPQSIYLSRWYPADFYDLLNSIAIEIGELGRVDEARRMIDRVLSTPFAKNCPHWLDTKVELASKRQLVFAPFTMALGAPATTESQNEVEAQSEALDLHEAVQASQSQECKPAIVVRGARTCYSIASWPVTRFDIQPGRNTPRLMFQPIYADRGYAISPPARAPPLQNPSQNATNLAHNRLAAAGVLSSHRPKGRGVQVGVCPLSLCLISCSKKLVSEMFSLGLCARPPPQSDGPERAPVRKPRAGSKPSNSIYHNRSTDTRRRLYVLFYASTTGGFPILHIVFPATSEGARVKLALRALENLWLSDA